jgi:hypothetical protein
MLATNERIREAGVIQSQAVLTAIRDDWEGGARCSASTPRIIRGSRRQSVRYCPRAVGSATTCEGGPHFRSRMMSGRVAEIVKMPPLTRCRHWRSDSKFSYTEPVQRRLRFQCLHALEHNFRLCSRIALHQEFIFFV